MLAASANEATLAGVYQAVHGGNSEIPAIVSEVSNWMETHPQSATEKSNNIPAPVVLEKTASQSGFTTGYCKDFLDGFYVWRYMSCVWRGNNNAISTGGVNSDPYANDRVYAWNNTAYYATMELWNSNSTALISTWKPLLQPYWVTWFSWGGSYSNATAVIRLSPGIWGEIGLSNHSRYLR